MKNFELLNVNKRNMINAIDNRNMITTIDNRNMILRTIYNLAVKKFDAGGGTAFNVYDKNNIKKISKCSRLSERDVGTLISAVMRMSKGKKKSGYDCGIGDRGAFYLDIAEYMYTARKTKWTNYPKYKESTDSKSGEGSSFKNSKAFGEMVVVLIDHFGEDNLQLVDWSVGDGKSYAHVPLDTMEKCFLSDLSHTAVGMAKKNLCIDDRHVFFHGIGMDTPAAIDMLHDLTSSPALIVCRTVFQHMMFDQIDNTIANINTVSMGREVYLLYTNLSDQMDDEINSMDILPFGYRSLNFSRYLVLKGVLGEEPISYKQNVRTGGAETEEYLCICKIFEGVWEPVDVKNL
jgi:hypothetical protein